MNIELYIAGQLCDLEKADLGIKLRRQLYNPKELNTKDSQKSYSITLPATARNNEIFGHKNVEETVGKFTLYPDARLYVNNILILDGKFRLSEISSKGYRGNLGVPAPLTAKDVFGERKMNDIGSWPLKDFKGEKSFAEYNRPPAEGEEPKECIFPLVLYGLLPNTNNAVIKQGTKFSLYDFPPSVNCMQMLKTIFTNVGYTLTGTALDDERLKQLYVSYKNPEDYIMPFEVKKAILKGEWTNCIIDPRNKNEYHIVEKEVMINQYNYPGYENPGKNYGFVACNLFRSDNFKPQILEDETNQFLKLNDNFIEYKVAQTGLYKIDLEANIKLKHNNIWNSNYNVRVPSKDLNQEELYIVEVAQNWKMRSFRNVACELKLVRSQDSSKYDISNAKMDCIFYKNNLEQPVGDPNAIFPKPGRVNFIDQKQNPDLLCGFSWGRLTKDNDYWYDYKVEKYKIPEYTNPLWKYFSDKIDDEDVSKLCDFTHPIAIKHGNSWEVDIKTKIESAVYSPGYEKVNQGANEQKRYVVDMKDKPNASQREYPTHAESRVWWGNEEAGNSDSANILLGSGRIQQVVFLNAGEYINLVATQDRSNNLDWIAQDIDFTLSIEPFSKDNNWLKMQDKEKDLAPNGSSSATMYWSDSSSLLEDQIDLIEFLPREVKIDDWITNFCKAFNLELIHTKEKSFALNIKQQNIVKNTSLVIDLDKKTSVMHASNETLALPRTYKLGFTTDTAEEGYVESTEGKDMADGEKGGGIFETGSSENNQIEQTSNFSYCWYKILSKDYDKDNSTIKVPVISDHEIWSGEKGKNESSNKAYLNKAQRFWYHAGTTEKLQIHKTETEVAMVSNEFRKGNKPLILNYHDKPNSIMREYFTLQTNDKELTTIECYLTPDEYDMLDKALVRFNGDLYNVVEADSFDPLGKQKTKLKLIKKL